MRSGCSGPPALGLSKLHTSPSSEPDPSRQCSPLDCRCVHSPRPSGDGMNSTSKVSSHKNPTQLYVDSPVETDNRRQPSDTGGVILIQIQRFECHSVAHGISKGRWPVLLSTLTPVCSLHVPTDREHAPVSIRQCRANKRHDNCKLSLHRTGHPGISESTTKAQLSCV